MAWLGLASRAIPDLLIILFTSIFLVYTKEHKFSKNANVLNQVKIKFMHKLRDSKLTLSPLYFNKPPISYLITISEYKAQLGQKDYKFTF